MSLLFTFARRTGGGRRRPRRPSALQQCSSFLAPTLDSHDDDGNDRKTYYYQSQQQRNNVSCIRPRNESPQSKLLHYNRDIQQISSSSSASMNNANANANNAISTTPRRQYYHTTPKREILPLLAVGFLGASAVYTYRSFQQMDQDWDDYYDELEEYKAVTGIDPEKQQQRAASMSGSGNDAASAAAATNSNEELSNYFTGGTLAIDMGTTRLKLSHRSSLANKSHYTNNGKQPPAPIVSVDREGFRSTPSLAWMPPSTGGGEEILVGRLAEARSYDTKGGNVVHPRESPVEENKGGAMNETALQQTIRGVAGNALDQALGNSGGASNSNNPLFVLDASMATTAGSYNVRPIFTYPPQQETAADAKKSFLERYRQAMNGLTSPAGIAAFVPEPVAIVAGAEYYNLLPAKNSSSAGNNSVLVVDVGGTSTCITVVGGDNGENEVMYSTTLPFGGDTFVDLLVSHLAQGFYDEEVNGTSEANNELSAKPDLNDPTALQRLYEASTTAIHELSNKTRSEINIPYLTMDLKTRQPKHLEVGMSRNVIESEAEAWVRNKLVPYLQQSDNQATTLSQALPPPTNLSTLFSSAVMSSLEQTSLTPHMLRAILLVGGGARIPLIRESMKEGVGLLAGDAYANGSGGEGKRLINPEGEMGEELGVLGAAVWGSGAGR